MNINRLNKRMQTKGGGAKDRDVHPKKNKSALTLRSQHDGVQSVFWCWQQISINSRYVVAYTDAYR